MDVLSHNASAAKQPSVEGGGPQSNASDQGTPVTAKEMQQAQ